MARINIPFSVGPRHKGKYKEGTEPANDHEVVARLPKVQEYSKKMAANPRKFLDEIAITQKEAAKKKAAEKKAKKAAEKAAKPAAKEAKKTDKAAESAKAATRQGGTGQGSSRQGGTRQTSAAHRSAGPGYYNATDMRYYASLTQR